jgi:hypothetical protein
MNKTKKEVILFGQWVDYRGFKGRLDLEKGTKLESSRFMLFCRSSLFGRFVT